MHAQAPLDEGIDPIDVFWPVYEGAFAVTPSSAVGRITWPTLALGSLANVTIEIEHDEVWGSDRSDDQLESASAKFGGESGDSEASQGARQLRVDVAVPLLKICESVSPGKNRRGKIASRP